MIVPRYHCGEEMDYVGNTKQGHAFVCRYCDETEYSNDPTLPTTPNEIARNDPTQYGSQTKIGPW